jgi:hypothetical protein
VIQRLKASTLPINNERNLRARAQLILALRTSQPFAFTGAGVSIYAGYGSWKQVIRRLADRVAERCGEEVNADVVVRNYEADPLLCAQKLGRYLGNVEFGDFVRNEFGPNGVSPADVLYRLVGMPFRHFATLNFDPSLEQVHGVLGRPCGSVSTSDRRSIARFMREMDGKDCTRQVIHLHGMHSDAPEFIALTEQGYRRLYRDNQWFTNFLWLLAVSKRLVFMGFSFQDFDLLSNLRDATRDIQENGLCHFAIVHIRPDDDDGPIRTQLNDRYLIEPIFYEVIGDDEHADHRGFVELVNGLSDELGVTASAPDAAVPGNGEVLAAQPEADDIRRAEQLGDALLGRIDPGGGDVPA